MTEVYLIGPKGSIKKNSFTHMTGDYEVARKLLGEIPFGELKKVKVPPKRRDRR